MTVNDGIKVLSKALRILADCIDCDLMGAESIPDEIPKEVESKVKIPVEPTVTKEELHNLLKAKTKDGKRKEVKDILTKFGDGTFTHLDEKCYSAVFKEAEVL